jgi:prepilin-type N-terminal cleavage/methylation domain-containing protein
MKNKKLSKLLKKNKPNSGFTLYELLVGLVISGVVIGALGFGLITLLNKSQTGNSKTKARNETARAMEFISEEIKRSKKIETNVTLASLNTDDDSATPDDETIAPSYTPPTGGTPVLALQIPNVDERVIYSIAPPGTSSPWKGPLVVYRWGPNLTADGDYSDPDDVTDWSNEPLIDEVDITALASSPCITGETLVPSSTSAKTGFHACVISNDNTNTARLFLNTANEGYYSADGKAVARSKNKDFDNSEVGAIKPLYFKTLGATYNCKTGSEWKMRTDFNNSSDPEALANVDKTTPWLHDDDRQPQPININPSNPLKISASAVGATGCISTGNAYRKTDNTIPTNGSEKFSEYTNSVSFTINFNNPATFNGGTTDRPDVTGDKYVMVYRKGSTITALKGYDPDNDPTTTDNQQQAIGDFLVSKGYAVKIGTTYRLFQGKDDPLLNIPGEPGYVSTKPTSIILADNERLISMEVGQFDNGLAKSTEGASDFNDVTGDDQDDYYDINGDGQMHPGFDGQDSVFIISNEKFKPTAATP